MPFPISSPYLKLDQQEGILTPGKLAAAIVVVATILVLIQIAFSTRTAEARNFNMGLLMAWILFVVFAAMAIWTKNGAVLAKITILIALLLFTIATWLYFKEEWPAPTEPVSEYGWPRNAALLYTAGIGFVGLTAVAVFL